MNWLDSIYSDGSKYFVSNPLPKIGEKIKIYLRVLEEAPVKNVFLFTKINGVESLIPMKIENVKSGLAYYACEVTVYGDLFHYHFILSTENKIYHYNQLEVTDYVLEESYDFKILPGYKQPKWVKESVFYQIFPERFCNGNKENDVRDEEYYFDGHPTIKVKDWNSIPKNYNEVFCLDFYGGDLEGIKDKIPYLKKLGINAIYLNPIFYAATIHKYDCLDYFHVDPHFGGDKAFEELMNELHKNNIRLVLDTSINHTGIANKWFNKDGIFFDKSIGAYNNKDSKERNYYYFNDDNSYKSWFDVETLPTLNYTSKELREILYEGEDSLVKKWLKPPYNIDGWRFDVADTMARNNEVQLHHEVWPAIRKSIKEENEDAYILAEDWSDASEFLKGDEWDSSMNYYGFTRPIREFVGEIDIFNGKSQELIKVRNKLTARNLANRIMKYYYKLPFVIQENQFNLLDSHDVPRLHNNPEIDYDVYRGAVIMMFTMIGTPSIYYGDEAEIDGRISEMEGCRYPMPWNRDFTKGKFYKLYSKLIDLKRNNDALKYGGIKIIGTEDYVFAFARFTLDEVMITVCSNDSEDRELFIPTRIFGRFSELPKEDIFGYKLNYKKVESGVILEVPSKVSYLFNLK